MWLTCGVLAQLVQGCCGGPPLHLQGLLNSKLFEKLPLMLSTALPRYKWVVTQWERQ